MLLTETRKTAVRSRRGAGNHAEEQKHTLYLRFRVCSCAPRRNP